MKWQPYPEYKDSSVEWLGEIPAHWDVRKLKHIASVQFSNVDKHTVDGEQPVRLCNYTDVYYNDYITPDLDFMRATATLTEIDKFKLKKGDVIITKDSETWDDIAVPAYVVMDSGDLVCGYHLAQIRPNRRVIDGEYLFRSFCTGGINHQFQVAATGVTRYGLGKYGLDNALFFVPPPNEQRAIAAFLDRETGRIDALIARKERQMELLQEKRAALISHAVTKGLDPDAPMKDSGIEWLGEIPVHWEVAQLRRVVAKFVDYRGRTPTKVESGVPLITARNIKDGRIDFSLSQEYMREDEYEEWMVRGWPEVGDVLVTTEAPLGETAQIVDTKVALAQRIILLKVNAEKMLKGYLKYHFMSAFGQGELWSQASGSTALGIRADRFKGSLVVIPPLNEQETIARLLRDKLDDLEKPISRIERSIEVLSEYRAALISAAVTGKIDVRAEGSRTLEEAIP